MAEYYPLLAKAVGSLPNSTPETRRVVYERARKALIGQLRTLHPPVPDDDIEHESVELDRAIGRLESELARAATAAPPDVPPPPAGAKPVDAKPVDAKPVDAKPVDAKPVDAKPVDAKPVDAKPVDAKPVDAKPVEAKPVEPKPVEPKLVEAPKPALPIAEPAKPSAFADKPFPMLRTKTPAPRMPGAPSAPPTTEPAPPRPAPPPLTPPGGDGARHASMGNGRSRRSRLSPRGRNGAFGSSPSVSAWSSPSWASRLGSCATVPKRSRG